MSTGFEPISEQQQRRQCGKLSTGCDVVDTLLQGGFHCRSVTEISGAAGSGKTQFLLRLLVLHQPSVYIFTEGNPPTSRLEEIAATYFNDASAEEIHQTLEQVLVCKAPTAALLWETVDRRLPALLASQGEEEEGLKLGRPIQLVVIDSVGAIFRVGSEFGSSSSEIIDRSIWLFSLAAKLKALNEKYGTTTVIANQVSCSLRGGRTKLVPALGLSWSHCIDTRLMIRKKFVQGAYAYGEGGTEESLTIRELEILFSHCHPENTCYFLIKKHGISGVNITT